MQNTILWIYVVLLMIGGFIGFYKGKSRTSLTMSVIFSAGLILTLLPGLLDLGFRRNLANLLLAVLLVVFGLRLARTKKWMPAGMMLVFTLITLALRNLRF